MPHIRLILQDTTKETLALALRSGSTNSRARSARPSIRSSRPRRSSRGRLCPRSSAPCSKEPSSASSSLIGGEKQDLRLPRLNGKERVRIETIHGSFEFAEQRFLLPDTGPAGAT
jgi:hypothetical protein